MILGNFHVLYSTTVMYLEPLLNFYGVFERWTEINISLFELTNTLKSILL